MTFKKFFEHYGDTLFVAYQRARADGSDEGFAQWVLGEYDVCRRDGVDYEVAYGGLFDSHIYDRV
jgi:hypothetical protein